MYPSSGRHGRGQGTVSNLSCVLPGHNTRYRGGLFTAPSLVHQDCTGRMQPRQLCGDSTLVVSEKGPKEGESDAEAEG